MYSVTYRAMLHYIIMLSWLCNLYITYSLVGLAVVLMAVELSMKVYNPVASPTLRLMHVQHNSTIENPLVSLPEFIVLKNDISLQK